MKIGGVTQDGVINWELGIRNYELEIKKESEIQYIGLITNSKRQFILLFSHCELKIHNS